MTFQGLPGKAARVAHGGERVNNHIGPAEGQQLSLTLGKLHHQIGLRWKLDKTQDL